MKKMKKVLAMMLAMALVCGISIAGTLAYLTASQSGDEAVINTFVVGNLLDPEPDPVTEEVIVDPDVDPEKEAELTPGLYLMENYADFNMETGLYELTDTYVLRNNYARAIPAMEIPKNPSLSVDIDTGMKAFIFVKVTDNLATVDLGDGLTEKSLSYAVNTDVWKEIEVANAKENETVYCYTGDYIVGVEGYDLSFEQILVDMDTFATSRIDGPSVLVSTAYTTENEDQPIGNLTFEAYVCQAEGFTSVNENQEVVSDPVKAFNTLF